MNLLTPLISKYFLPIARRTDCWAQQLADIQISQLRRLLRKAENTEPGKRYDFHDLARLQNPYEAFKRSVPLCQYEDVRESVLRMIRGEKNVLWPGICRNFAQSSGTSGGKSKYIPITDESLKLNHYQGGTDAVAHYLRQNPDSRIFEGKAFILGGSFANELNISNPAVKVGDLSATLINNINPVANMVRIPSKSTALLADWNVKLPALVKESMNQNVTNISGVPSWFLSVIKEILNKKGAESLRDVWPNLEVFWHGGISFEPYREIYQHLTKGMNMHFMENYNASEGFFAVQDQLDNNAMLLLIDAGIFFEFKEMGKEPVCAADVEPGRIYELIITSCNGLWRYRVGDTVRVESKSPLRIKVAGRTKSFINAFGEELMEDNAERAIAIACQETGAAIRNYTAAPVFAGEKNKGRHQWLIEWEKEPDNLSKFTEILDYQLRELNSDYAAKRSGNLFLDKPVVTSATGGAFDRWLASAGNHKLGGQRKVPRLSNSRDVIEKVLSLC